MEIDTEFAVKTFHKTPAFVQVYFEAVANAFDAGASRIFIEIETAGPNIKPEGIRIRDDGEGFTDERFERFRQLAEPHDKYHKGVGRLVYLHYFSKVDVVSVYRQQRRSFTFSTKFDGKSVCTVAAASAAPGTMFHFHGFNSSRIKSADDLKPAALKRRLLEHFLPLLHHRKQKGIEFTIEISLKTEAGSLIPDTQTISLSDVPSLKQKYIQDNTVDVYDKISMEYMIGNDFGQGLQLIAACIDERTIPLNLLPAKAIPPSRTAIFLFRYERFTESDSSRQRLVLPEDIPEAILFRILRREISIVLNEQLPEIVEKNTRTKEQFEQRYPHLTGLFEEDTVGLIDHDEALEAAQARFFKTQKAVLESDTLDDATFAKSLDVSARTLTEYILYRELIIKRFSQMTEKSKEADIHNLIVPRYQNFQGPGLADGIYHNNAWLLDDKFMTFRTILSEAKMKELIAAITLNEEAGGDMDGRPDIAMIFSADPAKERKVDVVVVEIKPRRIDDKENMNVINQLMSRAEKLVEHCPEVQRVWYFGIIEIDSAFARKLRGQDWSPLFSRGQVFYRELKAIRPSDNSDVPMPTYLLSFDALIQDAAARNHTFLEILKAGFKIQSLQ